MAAKALIFPSFTETLGLPLLEAKSYGIDILASNRNFAKDYGVLLVDGPLSGITARAVIVIDKNNKIIHSELVSEIANEPNYDDALNCMS